MIDQIEEVKNLDYQTFDFDLGFISNMNTSMPKRFEENKEKEMRKNLLVNEQLERLYEFVD